MERNELIIMASLILVIAVAATYVTGSITGNVVSGGFDEFGYNYKARIFVGAADGVDKIIDGTVWGDPTYANDRLVMRWSKGWDDARFKGKPWTTDAWEDNIWNGAVQGGSGEVWHYKIRWIGACGVDGTPLEDGGYCIWGQFEVLMDQGTAGGEHTWYAHAIPTGYGAL